MAVYNPITNTVKCQFIWARIYTMVASLQMEKASEKKEKEKERNRFREFTVTICCRWRDGIAR